MIKYFGVSLLLICLTSCAFDDDDMDFDLLDSGIESDEDTQFHHSSHFRGLNDAVRVKKFREAIEASVAGKSVLNIGSGVGLLAMMAARAGATHVWAIERNSQAAKMARVIIARNKLQHNITVIRARSQDVYVDRSCAPGTPCIPFKPEVLISDTLCAELFRHQWTEILVDAKRLVRADAIIIPKRARVYVTPVWSAYTLSVSGFVDGFDLAPIRELKSVSHHDAYACSIPHVKMTDSPLKALTFEFDVGVAIQYSGVDFPFKANGTGVISSMMLHWEADLAPGVVISSGPERGADSGQMWYGQMWYHMVKDLEVTKDTALRLSLLHDANRFYPHVYMEGEKSAFLSFYNKCEFDVQIFWAKGAKGEEHRSGVLVSGAELVQQTFHNDHWFLRWNNGVAIVEFETPPGQSRVIIEKNHTASIIRAEFK